MGHLRRWDIHTDDDEDMAFGWIAWNIFPLFSLSIEPLSMERLTPVQSSFKKLK